MVERHGDPWGTIYMRKFACRYLQGASGIRAFRDRITRAEDAADFRAIVDEHFPTWALPLADAAEFEEPACA